MAPRHPFVWLRQALRWWGGLLDLTSHRLIGDLLGRRATRLRSAVVVVALAVAILVLVTSISLGLVTQTTVRGEDIDYWIVPQTASTLTTVVSIEGPQLGRVHPKTTAIADIAGVSAATPVLIELVQLRSADGQTTEYVLAIGIIPQAGPSSIAGIHTTPLTPGDPYYADGEYTGDFTGEVVLSPAAATLLNASRGDPLLFRSVATGRITQRFTTTAIGSAGLRTLQGDIPVAVMHLSELQAYTGAQRGDQADQILVRTTRPGVKAQLETVYPDASIVTRRGLATEQVLTSKVPLALSLTALVVGLCVAGLFLATTMGITVEAERRELAILGAIGFPTRTRLLLIGLSTLMLSGIGGIIGLGVGYSGIIVMNFVATTYFGTPPIGVLDPRLIPYGLGVAVVTGVLAAPYPLLLGSRTVLHEELGR